MPHRSRAVASIVATRRFALGATCMASAAILALAIADIHAAQAPWFPREVETSVAEQLASQLAEIGWGESAQRRTDRAREVIVALRTRMDQWGPVRLLARAPAFAELKMPATESRHLDAMARYSICSLVLMLQRQQPSAGADRNSQLAAVLGLTATTMAVLRLREPFLAAGGSDSAMEAFLSSNRALDAEFDRIQRTPALLTHARNACAPVLNALLE